MKRIIMATGIDERFQNIAIPYLAGMDKFSPFDNRCICVGFMPPESFQAAFPNIRFQELRRNLLHTDVPVNCVQNGDFLQLLDDVDDTDVILFTDADIRIQRRPTHRETEWLLGLDGCDVAVQWNESSRDTLLTEAPRLGMHLSLEAIAQKWRLSFSECPPVYNVGVIACTKFAYTLWHNTYVSYWNDVKDLFNHQAKQQWLMSWILAMTGSFSPQIQPYTFHTHGCYPLPPGARLEGEVLYYNGEVVWLRHNVKGQGW